LRDALRLGLFRAGLAIAVGRVRAAGGHVSAFPN